MSNKSQLQTNNTNLDALITRVNTAKNTAASLPNAGSATEDLNTELTTQEDLISQLSTILDSKASGGSSGGSVETCVVEIIADTPVSSTTMSWIDENGDICEQEYSATDVMMGLSITVLKNSAIYSTSGFFVDTAGTTSGEIYSFGKGNCLFVKSSGTFTIS